MAEDKNTGFGELEKLALIAESVQAMFSGKGTIIFELPKGEYASVINHFREIDRQHKQFTIDISGTDFHFILMEENKS
jgi:hypothetical protein